MTRKTRTVRRNVLQTTTATTHKVPKNNHCYLTNGVPIVRPPSRYAMGTYNSLLASAGLWYELHRDAPPSPREPALRPTLMDSTSGVLTAGVSSVHGRAQVRKGTFVVAFSSGDGPSLQGSVFGLLCIREPSSRVTPRATRTHPSRFQLGPPCARPHFWPGITKPELM